MSLYQDMWKLIQENQQLCLDQVCLLISNILQDKNIDQKNFEKYYHYE